MKNKIITGLSALYDLGFSKFKPNYIHIELPTGTNTTNLSSKYKISTQSSSTISIGTIKYNNKLYYCPERLFIELDKYDIENTIKKTCLDGLIKNINPQKVLDIYERIKNKRRGIDKSRIEEYLDKNLLLIDKYLINSNDRAQIIREYILSLMGKKDFPISLIKGGSAIELFVSFKRATEDIDSHVSNEDLEKIKEYLTNKELLIYFDINVKNNKSLIKKWELIPKSRKLILNEILKTINSIDLNLNTSYSKEEINSMIKEFNIIKKPLKNIKNAKVIVFNQEMLLAEKFQSLISKPETTTRTKDLIDLYFIHEENGKNIDYDSFKKWVFFKWEKSNRNPLNKNQVLKKIKENKNIESKHVKENFSSAIRMYQEKEIDYDEARKLFLELCEKF